MVKSIVASRREVLRMGAVLGAGALLYTPHVARAASTPVNIVSSSGNFVLIMQLMLKQLGFLSDFGIEPHFSNASDGNRITGSLVSGETDICMYSGFGQVPIAIEKGARLKIVAGASLVPFQCVFAKKPEIKSVKDLEGRTVGVGSLGSLLHQLMVALLTKKGVDVSKVTFANVGSSTEIFRAVVAGVVDAGPATIEVYDKQAKFGVHSLSDGEFWNELPEYTNQGSYTSDRAIAAKRDALVRVLAGYAKFYRFLQSGDSKDAFVKASVAVIGPNADVSATSFQWNFFQKNKPFAGDLVLSEERIRFIEKLNIDSGAQAKNLPLDQLTDMSLARDAIKLLGA
jgi:ABC-type nitrate/sulfonate/bicarbonate transport system substrate-binding protein